MVTHEPIWKRQTTPKETVKAMGYPLNLRESLICIPHIVVTLNLDFIIVEDLVPPDDPYEPPTHKNRTVLVFINLSVVHTSPVGPPKHAQIRISLRVSVN